MLEEEEGRNVPVEVTCQYQAVRYSVSLAEWVVDLFLYSGCRSHKNAAAAADNIRLADSASATIPVHAH
jgi:hypothetical protein